MSVLAQTSLQLSGLHCAACAGQIEAALAAVGGVVEARVNAAASRARVRWDPQRTRPSDLVAAVRAAGYGAAPDTAQGARELRTREERRWLWRLFVASLCGMQVMMLATPAYVADPGTLAPDLLRLLQVSAWTLTLPVLAFSAGPFFAGAWRSLRAGTLGMDVPVALGIAVAFVASSGAAFAPGGAFGTEVYFDSLTMFVAFLLAGRWLEARARHRAAETVERLAFAAPRTAWRLRGDGGVDAVDADALEPGDRVRVPAGEAFAADGRLEGDAASVDESMLTGESRPVAKHPGDALVAGSVNLGASALLRVERVGADTRREQIAALMREALTQRPRAVRIADRIAAPFLLAVLLLAAGAAAWWWPSDPARALTVATSVLIVTCPCALSLAVPSVLLAATSGLARRGVLLCRVEALETLARVDRAMLDKTGTVTEPQAGAAGLRWRGVGAVPLGAAVSAGATGGLPGVDADDRADDGADDGADAGDDAGVAAGGRRGDGQDDGLPDRLADRAASLAAHSTHPVSQALVAARPTAPPQRWVAVREHAGLGVEGRDGDGRRWRLGAPRWWGAAAPEADLVFGTEHAPQLAFDLDEALRDGAADAVHALRTSGIAVTLLSGDAPARVATLARRLAIDDAVADATPERKLHVVRGAQQAGGTVAMVGDGVNDAPVLAQADVSFAMGDGAQIARNAADVVLLSGRLDGVSQAIRMARRSARVIRQNLAWAAVYNVGAVPLAVSGHLPPWAAGLGMAASSLLVVLNATRLARG